MQYTVLELERGSAEPREMKDFARRGRGARRGLLGTLMGADQGIDS